MAHDPADELLRDLGLLDELLGDTVRGQSGDAALALVEGLEADALALRSGALAGGRSAFAGRFAELDLDSLQMVGRAFTLLFHLFNAAEEQHRIRVLRRRDRSNAPPDGSLAAACAELAAAGVSADDMRGLLGRLFVMPVLTAHPTEARRRTVIELLAQVSGSLDRLDDPRAGAHERSGVMERLREVVLILYTTEQARSIRPAPVDEVRAALGVFESTLLDVTPLLYRSLEDALAEAWPGERFTVGPFLRWGTWIGGDRDGNPHVTAEVTEPEKIKVPGPMTTTTSERRSQILYHYTSAAGLVGIMACSCIDPSTSEDNNAAFGAGVYWTDITPGRAAGVTRGQFSYALTSSPRAGWNGKYDYFLEVDVASLAVPPDWVAPTFGDRFPGNSIFLSRTARTLPVQIRSSGAVW